MKQNTYMGKTDIDTTGLYRKRCFYNSDNSSTHFLTCYIQCGHNSRPPTTPALPQGTL